MESNDVLVKLLIIGESAVGKSCLLMRFAEDKFTDSFLTTIGIDFKVRHVEINDTKVKLQIWDTAGQEKFRTITKAYYRGAHGILLVFDVTVRESFDQTRMWMNSIKENMTDPVTVVLVGNKCDMQRMVSTEEGAAMAKEFGVEYFETSAKEGTNVETTFMHLAERIMTTKPKISTPTVAISPKDLKKKKSKGCC